MSFPSGFRISTKILAVIMRLSAAAARITRYSVNALSTLAVQSWRRLDRSRKHPRDFDQLAAGFRLATGFVRPNLDRPLRRLPCAIATMLATMGAPGSALAQGCDGLSACQSVDQEALLSSFSTLPNTPAGLALLAKNLQTEESIYLNATQAQKATAGTIMILAEVYANILIGAFPTNPKYGYDSTTGVPFAPLPPSLVSDAVSSIAANTQVVTVKNYIGQNYNIYAQQYGYAGPYASPPDSNGNPAPFQVSAAIGSSPFTPANSSLLAYQVQQTTIGAYGQNWQLNTNTSAFPSAHSMLGNGDAISYAIFAPGYYQQFVQSGVLFAYSPNVFGVHFPLDAIGGRILATYVIAQTLAGNPLYPSTFAIPGTLASASQAMQSYLAGNGDSAGGSSPYAAQCAGHVAACVGSGTIPSAAAYTQALQNYSYYLTYGLPSVGDTSLQPVVPSGAYALIATRFPYLNQAQLNQILYTTELPSGVPLDNGTGWARLNLYAAAGGYGAFPSKVTVNMNAANGGLNAFDVWSNNISGRGGLTLQGTGTLILAGNDSYTGGTNVQGGTLAVTGTLGGNLAISPGATFVSNGGYTVARNATLANAGTFIEVNQPLTNAGTAGNTGTFVGDVSNSGHFNNNAIVTGAFTNSGLFSGNGVVGSLALLPGSTIAPSNSVGTIGIIGNLTVAPGAIYQFQVGANGGDLIQAGGTATLSGGTVVATGIGNNLALGSPYPILTATGGVTGLFGNVTGNFAFLTPSLSYDPHDVLLTLTRNGVAFAGVAATPNQAVVADAISAGGSGSGLSVALLSQTAAGARQAFDTLSGEIHASARTVMLDDSIYLREAVLGRLRQASFAGGLGPMAALASGGPTLAYADESGSPPSRSGTGSALAYAGGQPPAFPVRAAPAAVPETTFWTQGVGAWGRLDGDGNAAGVSRTLAGFFSGVDRRFGPNWLAGLAGGYTSSSVSMSDRASSANIDTAHLAGYAGAGYGPWNLRTAAAVSWSTLGTSRSIVFPGFVDTANAHYGATTAQIFGEVGYGVAFGQVAAEPFGGLAFVHLRTDSFAEIGGTGLGIAALGGSGSGDDVGYSTLGGRAATNYVLPNGMVLTPRVSAAWEHAFGSVTPTAALAFQSTGAPLTIAGVPLARDAALVQSGLDLRLNPQTRLGLLYSSQLGSHVRDNTVQGNLTWLF